MTRGVKDGDTIRVGALVVHAVSTPCHTPDSITYVVRPPSSPPSHRAVGKAADDGISQLPSLAFTGDTLFTAGQRDGHLSTNLEFEIPLSFNLAFLSMPFSQFILTCVLGCFLALPLTQITPLTLYKNHA